MRPPLCAVCGTNDFDRFTAPGSENVVLFVDHAPPEPAPDGLEKVGGNPFPGSDWFCDEHLAQAQQLSHLTIAEALAVIGEQTAGVTTNLSDLRAGMSREQEHFTYKESDGVAFGLPGIERLCELFDVDPENLRPGFLELAQRNALSLPEREALIEAGVLTRDELPPW